LTNENGARHISENGSGGGITRTLNQPVSEPVSGIARTLNQPVSEPVNTTDGRKRREAHTIRHIIRSIVKR
jgi:hypothetical protein